MLDPGSVVGPFGLSSSAMGALDLQPDAAERDAEHALPALEQVDDLVRGSALVHADTVAHQRDLSQVGRATLAQMCHRCPDLLQRDASIEQALYYLEYQYVAEPVEPL